MSSLPSGERTWIDKAADRFEQQCTSGAQRPRIEDLLGEADPDQRARLLGELVRVECELRRAGGEEPKVQEYQARFPDDREAVAVAFGLEERPEPKRTVSAAENMLFGLLALQNRLIDRDALVAAFDAWAADKSKPLGQLLLDRKALSPSRYALLEQLVQDHIQHHGCDAERSLAVMRVVPEVRDQLEKVADLDFQCTLMSVAVADPDATADHRPEEDEAEDPEGRFQIVRFHDRGALGEVYLARDQQLHRIVALKRIRSAPATDKEKRARFVVEAEITGRLEHPGIVPVYSLGAFDDGRPFYAMRFIRGDNLKAAIDRFHRDEQAGRDAGARTLALQKLLRRFLDVCNAIAYAHSRGVVHRDLKPGNIMLGQYGETLVVDWGLAKSVGRAEQLPAQGSLDDRTLIPETGSDLRQTQEGSRLGTPAYMSPEQAKGEIGKLGPASDVYSLGATLYCLLTGRAPFKEQDLVALLHQVERGDFAPPRQLQPWIDPALEAICLKAMELKPSDRYATPRVLADDVEHWLADEPVLAYPEPLSARVRRWMRKHPSRVAAATVLLLATVVGLVIGGLLLDHSRRLLGRSNRLLAQKTDEAERQRRAAENSAREADRQRESADAMSKEARNAVDTYFNNVCETILTEGDPALAPYRKQLLTVALNYYQRFIKDRRDDARLRRELADAFLRVGQLFPGIEPGKAGQRETLRAVEMFEDLLAGSPGDRQLRKRLAASYRELAVPQYHAGQTKAALASMDRAVDLLAGLWAEDSSDFKVGRSLAEQYSWRALQRYDAGDNDGHTGDCQQAIAMLEKLVSIAPLEEKDATFGALADAYYRGFTLPCCIKAIDIQRKRAKSRGPGRVNLQGPLKNAGYQLIFLGQRAKAEALVREASEIQRTVYLLFPEGANFLLYLDWPTGEVGESLYLQGKTRAAAEQFRKTMDNWNDIRARRIPVGGNILINHSRFNYLLGCLEGERGNPVKGISHCERAMKEQQQVRDDQRGMKIENPEALSDLLWTREAIARMRFQARTISHDELINLQRQILVERKSISHPRKMGYVFAGQYEAEEAASAAVLAGHLIDASRPQEALSAVSEQLPILQRLVETDNPDNREVPDYDLRNFVFRQVWAELLSRQAEALAKLGRPSEAAKAIRQAIEIIEPFTKPEPCYLYDLA
jgi:serine/threonine protein kinase